MSPFEALIHLLVLPNCSKPNLVSAWLSIAVSNLHGFVTQPEVIRRSINATGMRAEVRRWSEAEYLHLAPSDNSNHLYLDKKGRLLKKTLDRRRFLRKEPQDKIADEIFVYSPLETLTENDLSLVQQRAISHLLPIGYINWSYLPQDRRQILITFGGCWHDAEIALSSTKGDEYLQTLQMFLGPKAHPHLRQEVLEAGIDGRHRPNPEVLSWLLAQTDWNLNPYLVAMARNAADDDPERAWELIHHPNPQVRLRLLDVYQSEADWFGWLVNESDDKVRNRLLSVIEQNYTPSMLVSQLSRETLASRKETIGWVLAHWRPIVDNPRDWQALNDSLFLGIGKANRKELKENLAKCGKLSLRGRFLS